jgi:predicted PurR-regulated permease PerM
MADGDLSSERPARAREPRSAPPGTRPRYFVPVTEAASDVPSGEDDWWLRATQVSVIGLFVLAVLAALYFTHAVVVPVLLAWVVATIFLPVVDRLEEWRVPRGIAVLMVVLALISVVAVLVAVLSLPLTYWIGRATEISTLIRQKLQSITQPFAIIQELRAVIAQVAGTDPGTIKVDQSSTNIVSGILSVLTPAVSQAILFLFAMIFYLTYQKKIRTAVVFLPSDRNTRLMAVRIFHDVERNMTTYFGAFTLVNVCLGAATVALAWLAGLPNPLLWGVLAAVLNYVPYIGVAIVVATLFLVGLFALPNVAQALMAPIAYIGMTTLEGQLLTPAVMGRQLTMNPFSVFLSIAFWTWMWGPIGAFLGTPLLIVMMVTVRHLFSNQRPDLPT